MISSCLGEQFIYNAVPPLRPSSKPRGYLNKPVYTLAGRALPFIKSILCASQRLRNFKKLASDCRASKW